MLNPFTLLEKYMDPVYQIVRLAVVGMAASSFRNTGNKQT